MLYYIDRYSVGRVITVNCRRKSRGLRNSGRRPDMTINYQRILEETLKSITKSGKTPRLLLHSCCGPCSSYVLEYLSSSFDITILYYNPNIYPKSEFEKRATEQQKLLTRMEFVNSVGMILSDYRADEFGAAAAGLETEPEGGGRCLQCFGLRLEETAKTTKKLGFDFFTTTLSVSPHKNAEALNNIGRELAEKYGVQYLCADFKKRGGYKRSIELSRRYGVYRQDYCGCRYSYEERKKDKQI